MNELYHLKNELVNMGEIIKEDTLLDIGLKGLSDECAHIRYSAEADDDISLNHAVGTIRNTYANRL